MKTFILIFIITFSIIVNSSISFANTTFSECPFKANAKVLFYSSYGKLNYDYTKNNQELSQMVGTPIAGLAERLVGYSVRGAFTLVKYGKGYCVVPTEIKAYIGISKPIIYVSSDYKPKSCYFNFILRHEQAHMQSSIRMIEQFITLAPNRIRYAEQYIKPLYIENQSDYQTASSQLLDSYSKIVKIMKDKLQEETDKEQKKIDGDNVKYLDNEVCYKHNEKEK